jgi:4-hydroxybenzoate polyprenyltransferase
MIPFLKLIRYKNLLMVLLTMYFTKYALIKAFFSQGYLSHFDFTIFSLSVLFITAGGYIINDIFDIRTDQINKPEKVIVGKSISEKNAWLLYTTLTFIGLGLGVFISIYKDLHLYILFFFIVILGLYLYSKFLQKTILLGNILIASLCSMSIYLVYLFDFRTNSNDFLKIGDLEGVENIGIGLTAILFYIVFSFITTLIREILKDIEDINGDYNQNYKTLPIVYGKRRTKNVCIGLTFVLIFMLFLFTSLVNAFKMQMLLVFLCAVILIVIAFLYSIWSITTAQEFKKASNIMKTVMLLGITSMALFIFD